jgi:hypothetical protein
MSDISLEQLCDLSLIFKDALDKQLDATTDNKNNALSSLTSRELAHIQEKEMHYAAEAFNATAIGVTAEFLKLELEVCDLTAQFAQKILEKDAVSLGLPAELLTQDAINALKEHGAHSLATLCEYKLSL